MDETKHSAYTPPTGTQSLHSLLTPTRPKPVEWMTECPAPAPESTCPTGPPQCARPPSKPEAESGEVRKGSLRADPMASQAKDPLKRTRRLQRRRGPNDAAESSPAAGRRVGVGGGQVARHVPPGEQLRQGDRAVRGHRELSLRLTGPPTPSAGSRAQQQQQQQQQLGSNPLPPPPPLLLLAK